LVPVERAQELRDTAWEIAASANSSKGYDHEAKFSDWMRQWTWLMSLEAGCTISDTIVLAERLGDMEIRLEAESLRANHDTCGLIELARSVGLQVIVVSDMYLEKRHLATLLNKVGIYVDEIFVSSEYSLTKRSGRLFQAVSAALNIGHGEIAHIGDNRDTDIAGAAKAGLGIRTVCYDEPCRVKRMRQKEFAWDQYVANGDAGEFIRIAAEDSSTDLRTGFTGYGHDVFGPAISTFIKRVAEIAEEREIDKVYFMAREGFLLKMVYELYQKSLAKNDGAVPAGYLCVSRLTTLKVTSGSYGLREVALGTVHAHTTLRKALGSLVGDNDRLASIAARHGFASLDEQFDQYFHPMFHLLVRDAELNEVIASNRDVARMEMEAYLDGIGFFRDRNVLLVDVGWAGQIQESFDTFLRDTGKKINVFGAYLATNHAAELRRAGGQVIIPAIADRNTKDYYSNSLFRNVDLLETICRAPHGSVVGYSNGTPIEASGEKREVEMQDDPMLAQMQKGVALYAASYFRLAKSYGIAAAQTMSTAKTALMRLHRFPEKNEAIVHQSVGHVASHWIGDKVEAAGPSSLRAQWRATHWKEGFLRETFGLVGLLAFSLLTAARREHSFERSASIQYPVLRTTPLKPVEKNTAQAIEEKANEVFTENWLRTDVDSRNIGKPHFRDRHLALAAVLARLHAFRNNYQLQTPATLSVKYAVKRKLFVEYPKARKALSKARSLVRHLRGMKR
jgi:FMN phosphatase YigB (HAD superfamily)